MEVVEAAAAVVVVVEEEEEEERKLVVVVVEAEAGEEMMLTMREARTKEMILAELAECSREPLALWLKRAMPGSNLGAATQLHWSARREDPGVQQSPACSQQISDRR